MVSFFDVLATGDARRNIFCCRTTENKIIKSY